MSEAATPKQVREYIDKRGVRCLECGGDQIEGGPMEVDAGWADQEIWCNDCGAAWVDKYTLSSVQHGDQEVEPSDSQGGMVPFSFEDWGQRTPTKEEWAQLHERIRGIARSLGAAKAEKLCKMLKEEG